MSGKVLIAAEARALQPQLGDGYDPFVTIGVSPKRDRAIDFNTQRENIANRTEIQSSELKELSSGSQTEELTLSGTFSDYVKAKFETIGVQDVFGTSSVFSVSCTISTAFEKVDSPLIINGLASLTKDDFQERYGSEVVQSVEFGGYLLLLFKLASQTSTASNNFKIALDLWKEGNLSLKDALRDHDVHDSWDMLVFQIGGTGPPFTTPSLDGFRAYLDTWVPTITNSPEPIYIFTKRYNDVVTGFPFSFGAIGGGGAIEL